MRLIKNVIKNLRTLDGSFKCLGILSLNLSLLFVVKATDKTPHMLKIIQPCLTEAYLTIFENILGKCKIIHLTMIPSIPVTILLILGKKFLKKHVLEVMPSAWARCLVDTQPPLIGLHHE